MGIPEQLVEATQQYSTDGESGLDDDAFDALAEEAKRQGYEIPTTAAGVDWPLVEHKHPMLGISFCTADGDEMCEMQIKEEFGGGWFSMKYDGMAVELQYMVGILAHAVLRGDGSRGEDVLPNVGRIFGVPDRLREPLDLAVYGEIVISFNNLAALNELRENDGLQPYKNPRNAVAYTRSKRASIHHLRLFTFRPYDVRPRAHEVSEMIAEMMRLSELHKPGGARFSPVDMHFGTSADAWRARNALDASRERWKYLLDGVVFRPRKADNRMVKMKFPPRSAVTTVTRVVEQLGRTGVVSPVCEFEPIRLAGVDVRRATVHNAELALSRLGGLGPGARILVSRRGDVIPHVEMVVQPSDQPWQPAKVCPSCGSTLTQDGAVWRCSSDPTACPGTTVGLLVEFARRIGIDGLGPGVASQLCMAGITAPHQLYRLEAEELGELIGPGVARKLCAKIGEKVVLTWGELLGALCIPGCARSLMDDVATRFPNDGKLMEAVRDGRLEEVPGIGPARAASISAYVDIRWNDLIQPLLQCVILAKPAAGGPLVGKTFCITLGLSVPRSEAESMIRVHGGSVKASVTADVTHVVCNAPNDATTKLDRARKLNKPIITEGELAAMMGLTSLSDSTDDKPPSEQEMF